MRPLTARDIETLGELEAANRNLTSVGFREGWARPLDCGGSNGSHHGATLAKLYWRGLVDRRSWKAARRTSWYKINKVGLAALKSGLAMPEIGAYMDVTAPTTRRRER